MWDDGCGVRVVSGNVGGGWDNGMMVVGCEWWVGRWWVKTRIGVQVS